MLKNSSSDKISILFANKSQICNHKSPQNLSLLNLEPIKKFETNDFKMAQTCFERGGASMLFNASSAFTNLYIDSLLKQMGLNIGQWLHDSSQLGEIKIFCSRKCNYIDFHVDEHETFTLQIRGTQRWRLHDSGIKNPIQGYSSHLQDAGLQEKQAKILYENGQNINYYHETERLLKESSIIDLAEGDILYCPSGMWQSYECLSDDSISITFSLNPMRWSDLLINGIKQFMFQSDYLRTPILLENQKEFTSNMEQALDIMLQQVKEFKEQWEVKGKLSVPSSLLQPMNLEYDLDKTVEENGYSCPVQLTINDSLRFNKVFSLIKISDLSQVSQDAWEAQYIVNGMFGNDKLHSNYRILLFTKRKSAQALVDKIVEIRTSGINEFKIQSILSSNEKSHDFQLQVLRSLCFHGTLVNQRESDLVDSKLQTQNQFANLERLVQLAEFQQLEGLEVNLEDFGVMSKEISKKSNDFHSDEIQPLKQSSAKSRHTCHQCHSEIFSDQSKNNLKISDHKKKGSHQRKRSYQRPDNNFKNSKYSSENNNSFTHVKGNDIQNEESQMSGEDSEDENKIYSDSQDISVDISIDPQFARNSSENTGKNGKESYNSKNKKKELDLAFLFADPLMLRNKRGDLVPMNQPLDTETEFREIQKIICNSKKQFLMRKEAANFETLKTIISKKPKIIHISCHGDYDEDSRQYYLAFEEKNSAILDKLSEERFKRLLGEGRDHRVHLAFVSACHSEMIGKLFLQANVPVVVAVNSQTMILDEVCQLFARHFYISLLEGDSPNLAFRKAQECCGGANIDMTSCCCAHSHKSSCSWVKYAQTHGYDKAHEIHTSNKCQCNMGGNRHKGRCNFLKKFIEEIQTFQDIDFLDPNLQLDSAQMICYDGPQTLCCCRPDTPHDESIKFTLQGEEKFKDKPIFVDREDGEVQIEADVNENNRLPSNIDSQMLIGRNSELQRIVQSLCTDKKGRIIHIYGPEGVGKSAIAKYAAKYTVERRVFPHGVFFIDSSNRTSGQGVLQKLCQKMQLQSLTKEQFADLIKMNTILIIFDNCKNVIEKGKDSFNKILKYLIENTSYLEIIVVTRDKDDIKDTKLKEAIKIDVLSRKNAARLLMKSGEDKVHLKSFKNPEDLAKHPLFDVISYKPSGIIQLAQLLGYQTLDEIFNNQQRIQQEEREQAEVIKQKQNMEYGEFSWILNIQFNKLRTSFKLEMNLLYFICQTPFGLTELDIEYICTEKPTLYGQWKKFLQEISKNESKDNEGQIQQNNKSVKSPQPSQSHQNFRMVTSNFIQELQENHYVVQPIVIEYINTIILKQDTKETSFIECFRYLSKLSRRLLRSIKYQEKKELDLQMITNEIDIGMWSDSHTQDPIQESILNQQLIFNPVIKFNYNESNFTSFIEVNVLKEHCKSLDYKNPIMYQLEELCTNSISILVMLNRYEEALALLNKSKQITDEYKALRFLKAKLEIMECAINLKLRLENPKTILNELEHAYQVFIDLSQYEGAGETCFLKAVALIKSLNQLLLGDEYNIQPIQSSGNLSVERGYSDLAPEQNKIKSPHLSSGSSLINQLKQFPSIPLEQQRQREATEVIKQLKEAMKFFKKENCLYGLAKTFLQYAEFEIDNKYGTGINLEYDSKTIRVHLEEAYLIFKNLGNEHLKARSLRNLAEVNLFDDEVYEAKRNIEEALKIIRKIQDTTQEAQALAALNKVHHLIRIKSNNCFIFAKAFPLIEIINEKAHQFKNIGSFTRFPSDFRKRIQEEVEKLGKVVNLKFDTLKRQHLDYLKTYGCRVLHLSSDVYKEDCLCIEGNNSEVEYIHIDEMKNLLKTDNNKLPVDLVVIAIPDSIKIAKVFIELGVPHVVAFDFNESIVQSTFMDNVYFNPKRFDYIYEFCLEFYKNLIKEYTVFQAWEKARPIITKNIKDLKEKLKGTKFHIKDIGRGSVLLPTNQQNHQVKLFNSQSMDERLTLKEGKIIDTSRVRGPTNIRKQLKPYTGRKLENFALLCHLKKSYVKVINISGLDGIGKTRFVEEVGYQINQRLQFLDGIFLVCLRKTKNIDQLKKKLKDINIGGGESLDLNANVQNKNILLILENVDKLIKHSKTQFDWWMQTLFSQCENIKLIITSKRKMNFKDQKSLLTKVRFIQLKPLNDIEAVDMLMSYCERQITPEELHLRPAEGDRVHTQLQQESTVKKCCGFPKYIQILAQLLDVKGFDKIDIRTYIPKKKNDKIQVERRKTIRMERRQHIDPHKSSSHDKRKQKQGHQMQNDPIEEEDENLEKSTLTIKHNAPLKLNDNKQKVSERMKNQISQHKMYEEDKKDSQKKSSFGDDKFFYENKDFSDLKQSQITSSKKGKDDSSDDESYQKIKVRAEMTRTEFLEPHMSRSIGPDDTFFNEDNRRIPNKSGGGSQLDQFLLADRLQDNMFNQEYYDATRTKTMQGNLFQSRDQIVTFQWGRESMMDKLRGTDPNAKVTLELPEKEELGVSRQVSTFSQPGDNQSEGRSRSNSDAFIGELKFSLYQQQQQELKLSMHKLYKNELLPIVGERHEEHLDSRAGSQIHDPHTLSTIQNIAQSNTQEENKVSKFNLEDDDDCVKSEEYDGVQSSYEEEGGDQETFDESIQAIRYAKQKSNFTGSVGSKPDSQKSFKKQNSERGKELKSKKGSFKQEGIAERGKELRGGKHSGKHAEKYQRKTKNPFNEGKEKRLEQKKKKKEQDMMLKQGQLQKNKKSSENLNEEVGERSSRSKESNSSPK